MRAVATFLLTTTTGSLRSTPFCLLELHQLPSPDAMAMAHHAAGDGGGSDAATMLFQAPALLAIGVNTIEIPLHETLSLRVTNCELREW